MGIGGFIEFRLIGAEKIEQKLLGMEKKIAKKVVIQSLRKGGKIIREGTRALAPTGKTGILKKSIIAKVARQSRNFPGVKALLQVFNTKKYPQLIRETKGASFNLYSRRRLTGRRAFYPAAVEYGRAARRDAGGPKVVQPKPFVRPGFFRNKKKAEIAIKTALIAGIKKSWRGK